MRRVEGQQLRERQVELEAIDESLRAVSGGAGRVLVVEGPAGIGKTSLLAAAQERASASGMMVLSARGGELEREFAWGVVRQLMEPALYHADRDEVDQWFAGAAAPARSLFSEAGSGRATEAEAQFHRRHGLYWLMAGLARSRPLLIAVDDAQWADAPSIGFLRHLAARLWHLPILLLVSSRPHRDGLSTLVLEPGASVVRPAPLSTGEVAEWLSDVLGAAVEPAFAAACQRATGGNPFLIRELAREIAAEGIRPTARAADRLRSLSPRGVLTATLLRLSGLSRSAEALARAAAVLGEEELSVAGELAGLTESEQLTAAADLVRAGVFEAAATVKFVHPLVRTALDQELTPAERAAAHGRAARLLQGRRVDPERVAAQLALSAPAREPWALDALRVVAARAARNGAPEVAARLLERAVHEAGDDQERFEVTLALGRAATLAQAPGAIEHLRAALALARRPPDFARAAITLGRALRYGGAGRDAVILLEQASARLGPADGELALRIEHELLATSTVSFGARRRLGERRERWACEPHRDPGASLSRLQHAAEAVEAAGRGDGASRILALAEAAQPLAAGRGHEGRHLRLLVLYALWSIDALDRMDPLVELVMADAERGGADVIAVGLAQRALVRARIGHLDGAEADGTEALGLAAELGAPPAFLLTAGAALFYVAAEREVPPHPLAVALRDDGDSFFARHLAHSRATWDLAEGRVEKGLAGLLALGQREQEIGWGGPAYFPWRSQAALAMAELGEHDEAARLAAEEVALARRLEATRVLGVALRTAGVIAGRGGEAQLREAVGLLERSGVQVELARALVDLGAAVRRAREPVRCRQLLRRGHELALRNGASRLAARARQELLAAGVRPRRTALSGPDSLTPSERRVVELAAEKLSNRQIAGRLYVTEKTVEAHLGRAFAKLGVASRHALTDALNPSAAAPAQAWAAPPK